MFLNEEFLNTYEKLNNLNEWVDSNNKKVTYSKLGPLYSGVPESCDCCGQIVEHPYDKFTKPFELVNGHKLCSSCLTDWVKLPEGFIDKIILISCYNNGECDQVVDSLKLTQTDIDEIIATWKQMKKAGQLNQLSPPRIQEIEDDFIEIVELLKLDASALKSLDEWVDKVGNKVGPQSSATSQTTTASIQPTSTNTKPRKQVKNKFGCLVDSWKPEFKKLIRHIYQVNGQPTDLQDSGLGDTILRLYFIVKSGEEWRLEVTTTKVSSLSKSIQMQEYWDYVLSTYRNGNEVIISRGHVQDYDAFLDVLLNQGIITNKSKCK